MGDDFDLLHRPMKYEHGREGIPTHRKLYAIVTHPVLVGGGTPFFTALDNWVNLKLVETRTLPGGLLLTRYETRR